MDVPGTFLGLERYDGAPVQYEFIDENSVWATGLEYDQEYVWYFSAGTRCGIPNACMGTFHTIKRPDPATGWVILGASDGGRER
jgi:hypothetical protein